MAASEAQQKLQELHATLNADLEKTRRELNELDTLLRQTNSEVNSSISAVKCLNNFAS